MVLLRLQIFKLFEESLCRKDSFGNPVGVPAQDLRAQGAELTRIRIRQNASVLTYHIADTTNNSSLGKSIGPKVISNQNSSKDKDIITLSELSDSKEFVTYNITNRPEVKEKKRL